MPYKSEAQRRFFHSAGAAKAGLSSKDVAEWDSASKGLKLPEKKSPEQMKEKRARVKNRHK